ncbi:hypothetical protein [Acinetobacter sp. ESBL14]|uniref:hypothetical protein n=1 Tax=Acinetobacter sp. ESBL14 TaxID=3077329 RepID=UPI002FC66178
MLKIALCVFLLAVVSAYFLNQSKAIKNTNDTPLAIAETTLPNSQELMTQFINTFPELKHSDFPPVDTDETVNSWLMRWQSDYDISSKYIATSEYKDWGWHIEKSLDHLGVVRDKKLDVQRRLNVMFTNIEKIEKDEEYLPLEDVYQTYYENVIDVILKEGFDVIAIDHGESAAFILAKTNNPEMLKLAELLRSVWIESQVDFYEAKLSSEYEFDFSIDKL